jgi:hypothetical protein
MLTCTKSVHQSWTVSEMDLLGATHHHAQSGPPPGLGTQIRSWSNHRCISRIEHRYSRHRDSHETCIPRSEVLILEARDLKESIILAECRWHSCCWIYGARTYRQMKEAQRTTVTHQPSQKTSVLVTFAMSNAKCGSTYTRCKGRLQGWETRHVD